MRSKHLIVGSRVCILTRPPTQTYSGRPKPLSTMCLDLTFHTLAFSVIQQMLTEWCLLWASPMLGAVEATKIRSNPLKELGEEARLMSSHADISSQADIFISFSDGSQGGRTCRGTRGQVLGGFRQIWQAELELHKRSQGSGLVETPVKGTAKVRDLSLQGITLIAV